MRGFTVFLIVGAILLIASEAAIGGITYPRNEVGIFETRLNAWPWDQPYQSTPVRSTAIFVAQNSDREAANSMDGGIIDRLCLAIRILRLQSNMIGLKLSLFSLEDDTITSRTTIIKR